MAKKYSKVVEKIICDRCGKEFCQPELENNLLPSYENVSSQVFLYECEGGNPVYAEFDLCSLCQIVIFHDYIYPELLEFVIREP